MDRGDAKGVGHDLDELGSCPDTPYAEGFIAGGGYSVMSDNLSTTTPTIYSHVILRQSHRVDRPTAFQFGVEWNRKFLLQIGQAEEPDRSVLLL
jgi:hypothetical protein